VEGLPGAETLERTFELRVRPWTGSSDVNRIGGRQLRHDIHSSGGEKTVKQKKLLLPWLLGLVMLLFGRILAFAYYQSKAPNPIMLDEARSLSVQHRLMRKKARVEVSGREHYVSIDAIEPGMILLVKAAEQIPADRVVLEGNSSDLAKQSAPVILMSEPLMTIVEVVELAYGAGAMVVSSLCGIGNSRMQFP
jgi:high-affinity K+ transport system ATPase subunit B